MTETVGISTKTKHSFCSLAGVCAHCLHVQQNTLCGGWVPIVPMGFAWEVQAETERWLDEQERIVE